MVRLMLVLAPVMCILSGIGISQMLNRYCKQLEPTSAVSSVTSSAHSHHSGVHSLQKSEPSEKKVRKQESNLVMKHEIASFFVLVSTGLLLSYTYHCIWVTSEAYSSPSIVLSARSHDGSRIIFDDFREAYYWLRQNTAEDAKVMSWFVWTHLSLLSLKIN
jgi:dolichyl-diphosphooligosaccharide--protein glycosyltransferase